MRKNPLLALALFITLASPGFGALGGDQNSVVADQTKLKAERTVLSRREFNVHQITRTDGTLIREYVSPAGKVFGVSWKGPAIPDLSQLLGASFAQFRNSVHPTPGRRRVAVVRSGDLVVESIGHQRGFSGRAYLTSMLPTGVTQEAVQ
jgi:hypothetical protein